MCIRDRAFARAGADPEILVIRNLTPADVAESCKALVKAIDISQIVMLPGGFSGGDEPDGSAKFIASFFRNPEVPEAVRRLLQPVSYTHLSSFLQARFPGRRSAGAAPDRCGTQNVPHCPGSVSYTHLRPYRYVTKLQTCLVWDKAKEKSLIS